MHAAACPCYASDTCDFVHTFPQLITNPGIIVSDLFFFFFFLFIFKSYVLGTGGERSIKNI